jgi:hypothetical protein
MKYFTRQLWEDDSDETGAASALQWEENLRAYYQQLQRLEGRLSTDAFTFFSTADVHDGRLRYFRLADAGWGEESGDHPVTAELGVFDSTGEQSWSLTYASVRRIVVDYPSDDPLFYSSGEGFGDWGYHELTDAQDGFLRHEILFASGSVLLVEFRTVAVTCSVIREGVSSREHR